jgi:hypothetical protein
MFEMAWHPLGHVLATGSKDQCVKFWARKGAGAALLQGGGKGGGNTDTSGTSTSGGGSQAAAAARVAAGGAKLLAFETHTSNQRLVSGASPLGSVVVNPGGAHEASEVTTGKVGNATAEEVKEDSTASASNHQGSERTNKRRRA